MKIIKIMNQVALAAVVLSMSTLSAVASASMTREQIVLGSGWKFFFSEKGEEKAEPILRTNYNDSDWQVVSVPHTWNNVGYYQNDTTSHINTEQNINKQYGIGWYRLNFNAPSSDTKEQAWLEFDAASRVAEVWLNGVRLGEHRGGFTRFRFDATKAIHLNQKNMLVVKTDNTKPTGDSSTADTLPIAGDFFVHGGLYRPVRLVFTDPVHFDMLDYGGSGVYATTDLSESNKARVKVSGRVKNDADESKKVKVLAQLVDAKGKTVAQAEQALTLKPKSLVMLQQNLVVTNPTLWQGQENPYLYTLRTEIRGSNNQVLDILEQQYGLRNIVVSPDKGFILNGKPLRLHGAAYHQDKEGLGWAVRPDNVKQDVDMLVEMGANTLRLAHYPHGQPVHDLADKYGLILWDEIPLVTSWTYGEKYQAANDGLMRNAELQLKEMIKQNFNHPSVAFWGVANEVDFGAVVPAFLGATRGNTPDPIPVLKALNEKVKELDPSRLSTLANCCESREGLEKIDIPKTSPVADTVGLNRYYGWYFGDVEDFGPHLDLMHAQYPKLPISVSEYGAGGAVSLHTDNVLGGPVDSRGHSQPEEYMSYIHEESWRTINSKPYLFASWIWNAFDFATTVRTEGDSKDINTKGIITYDRTTKKDAYYFYQANWTNKPMVHVTSSHYSPRHYQVTDVRVYSNLDRTELWLNGKSLGVKSGCELKICVWPNVSLAVGENTVIAKGVGQQSSIQDQANWQLNESQSNRYFIDAGALVAASSKQHTFGSDNFFKGGKSASFDQLGGWGQPPVKPDIAQTTDRDLATTYRRGSFEYNLLLKNGRYKVVLLTVVPKENESSHFVVKANGHKIAELDSSAQAPKPALSAKYLSAEVDVVDGKMTLQFEPVKGEAYVSAIEVTPL
ncbi:glycoside hydrolase family 2 [Marinomonas sp. CT5]|uniref:glycoside hydrolase family 2 TIM barrel-domain containing protein n=1 Tax=Marinomonas sp. CT5 TaxID=2066133 RepID=UPI001BAE95E6|nr:glycoside hydrolase family 2 TIM barrel-domain containing protein [Marinomonas sp. CT5]QUX96235.1 glycoside hydrolase family 2 [Marinomonas sp. CT5]